MVAIIYGSSTLNTEYVSQRLAAAFGAAPPSSRPGSAVSAGAPLSSRPSSATSPKSIRPGSGASAGRPRTGAPPTVDESCVGCGNCGEVYHDETRPTKVEGICDVCGSTNLKRRAEGLEPLTEDLLAVPL